MSGRQLPTNVNYLFVPEPLTIENLRSILKGIESDAIVHPVNPSYPTNSWVVHVYAAVADNNQHGYAILYDIPPAGETGQHLVQVSVVKGATEDEKVKNAAVMIGSGNELIGYEDMSGSQRAVIFRNTQVAVPPPDANTSLSWNSADHPERDTWSLKLLHLVYHLKPDLEAGNPDGFISGYDKLSVALQAKFWAEMMVAIARFESGWRPDDIYHEPPPLDQNSIGLLQLSLSDQNSPAYDVNPKITVETELQKPLLNLEWGMAIFAHWLNHDNVVAQGSGSNSRGAARYWSVLREGHKVDLIKGLTRARVGL